MANKPLKSFQFPGLPDRYTIPQLDATLTQSGYSADSKKVGDELNSLKDDLSDSSEVLGVSTNKLNYSAGYYIDENNQGAMTPSASGAYVCSDFIPCNPDLQSITITTANAGDYQNSHNAWYDKDKNFISSFSYTKNASKQLSTPANARYFRISYNKAVTVTLTYSYNRITDAVRERNISRYYGKKISIIGDSIDSFSAAGYKIDGYRSYYPAHDVLSVDQTWWKKVIDASGATLEVNASWSGSRVTNTHSDSTYPDFYDRVSVIGNPDVIFVTLGSNDSSNDVAIGEYDFDSDYTALSEATFRTAYIKGMKALQALYPSALIVSITERMNELYRNSIETICLVLGIEYINASDYKAVSGVHPGSVGMEQIARLVLFPTDNTLKQKHFSADSETVGRLSNAIATHAAMPIFRNGSMANLGRTDAIATQNIIPTYNATSARIHISRPLTSPTNYYRVQYNLYSIDAGLTALSNGYRIKSEINIDNEPFYIPFADGTKGFGFAIYEYKEDGTRVDPLNTASFEGYDIFVTLDSEKLSSVDLTRKTDTNAEAILALAQSGETYYTAAFVHGTLVGTTGEINTASIWRIVTRDIHLAQEKITFTIADGYRIYFCFYDENGTFTTNSGWVIGPNSISIPKGRYYRLQIAKIEPETTSIRANISELMSKLTYISGLKDEIKTLQDDVNYIGTDVTYNVVRPEFRNGSLMNTSRTDAIATKNIIPINYADSAIVLISKPLTEPTNYYRVQYTLFSIDNGVCHTNQANRVRSDKNIDTEPYVIPMIAGAKGFGFAVYEYQQDGTRVDPLNTTTFADYSITVVLNRKTPNKNDDYVIGSDLYKRYVTLDLKGSITNIQAFVKYEGNYISIKEGTITKQDSKFNRITTEEISIGHGNSIQRGSGNLAYVSGWDDNKIYIVNLDTLTVTGSITLPTTGYTTGVVDDVNHIAYIFQSDNTSTYQPWNFIVYDYQNSSTIATYKTIPFANIQGVDLFNNRIAVMHGMGTSASPSGLHIFNTRGEVISDYYFNTTIPSLSIEYEGVYIDRDDYTLYVSDNRQYVYSVTPLL